MSLVRGQFAIGPSTNHKELLLMAGRCEGTDMDKEGCSLQRHRAPREAVSHAAQIATVDHRTQARSQGTQAWASFA